MIKSVCKLLIGITLLAAPIVSRAQQLPVITNGMYEAVSLKLTESEKYLFQQGLMEIAKGFGSSLTNFVNTETNWFFNGSNVYDRGYVELTNGGPVFFNATNFSPGKRMRVFVWASRTNVVIAYNSIRVVGTNLVALASNKVAVIDFDMWDTTNVTARPAGQQ